MRDLLGPYTSYFNQKHGLSGRLWQGGFNSSVLDESHFWAAVRYVERNPVRAGMVKRAKDYRWSSAPAHCRLRDDPLLAPVANNADPIPDLVSVALGLGQRAGTQKCSEIAQRRVCG